MTSKVILQSVNFFVKIVLKLEKSQFKTFFRMYKIPDIELIISFIICKQINGQITQFSTGSKCRRP